MRFVEIISNKRFTLLSIFLFLYVILNLFDGERGLISFYEKQNLKSQLIIEKEMLNDKLSLIEKQNNLLTKNIDLDFLETLYREKFMVGKPKEVIYKINE